MDLKCCCPRKERANWKRYDENGNTESMPHVALMMKTFHFDNYAHTMLNCIAEYIDTRVMFGSNEASFPPGRRLCQEIECLKSRDRWKKRRNATVEELMGMSRVEVKNTVKHLLLHAHFQRMDFI